MAMNDKELFQKALLEAMVSKYDREITACTETAECSDRHLKKIKKILGINMKRCNEPKRLTKRAWIGVILAMALLLAGSIAVCAYHNEIRGFIVRIYEKYIEVSFDDDKKQSEGSKITEVYGLSYLPEGYLLTASSSSPLSTRYEWKNSEGTSIIFMQMQLDNAVFGLDAEHGETRIIERGNYKVYCRLIDSSNYCIWNDGKYAMDLMVPSVISDEEILKIIAGVQIISDNPG